MTKILGFESSCDDSSIAIVDQNFGVELNWTYTHQQPKFLGGVIPELASRTHQSAFKEALKVLQAHSSNLNDLSAVAYTCGPGLIGSLWVGASVAQALSWSQGLSLYPINHLHGHIFSPFIGRSLCDIRFPFLALLASGGHSQIWYVRSLNDLELMGQTRDDAAGEVLDKVARLAGLGYPGGPKIAQRAACYAESSFSFPVSDFGPESFDFSFSGMKSAFFRKFSQLNPLEQDSCCDKMLAGFEIAVVEGLLKQFEKAIKKTNASCLVLSGGVSANQRLRDRLQEVANRYHAEVFLPDLKYTGDNAAMIAACALLQKENGFNGINPIESDLKIFAS